MIGFRRLLILTIGMTFVLILWGGFVHNTGSSLACPDWPTCFGQIMPTMVGQVAIEHGHRMLASLVGILTFLLALFSSKKVFQGIKGLRVWCWTAFCMVVLQGILGGLTVLYQLPTAVSTAHLALAMTFFLTLIFIHHKVTRPLFLRPGQKEVSALKTLSSPRNVLFCFILTYGQVIYGALIRHMGLGAACGLGAKSSLLCTQSVHGQWQSTLWPTSLAAQLHMGHRLYAVFLGAFILYTLIFARRELKQLKHPNFDYITSLSKRLWPPLLFLTLQIGLGILTVGTYLGVEVTTLHLGGASLLLLSLYKLTLLFFPGDLGLRITIALRDMFSLMKVRLSSLVMVTAGAGIYLARGEMSLNQAIFVLLGIQLIVWGACVLNCYIERDVDQKMGRTQDRPLPQGRWSKGEVLFLGLFQLALGIPLLYFSSNLMTTILGLLALLLYLLAYTPMKQLGPYALFVGAIPGALPPLMGQTAVTGEMSWMGLSLAALLFVWQIPHFLSISLVHLEDFKRGKIQVYPASFRPKGIKVNLILFTLLMVAVGLMPGFAKGPQLDYLTWSLGVGVVPILLFWQKDFSEQWANFNPGPVGQHLPNWSLWSKRFFWVTLLYLPLVLLGMMLFLT